MATVFGPILRKTGGYGYDSFVPKCGLSDGPVYRRIEDALYAQRAESADGGILCRTVDEFTAHMSGWSECAA
jgi:hypothetical protein